MKEKIIFIIFGLNFFYYIILGSEIKRMNCTEEGTSACIDWENGYVFSEGIGVPSSKSKSIAQKNATAIRAAKIDAARNMLEMIKGININASSTVEDAMLTNDLIKTIVQGKLFGLQPRGKPNYFSDGSVSVLMRASISQTIPIGQINQTTKINSEDLGSSKNIVPVKKINEKDNLYTGLIVDARKINLKPAMVPKIFDAKGKELYGSAYVDQKFVQKHGMAGYVKNIEKAKLNDRVSDNPLILRAEKSTGKNFTDLILNNKDSIKLKNLSEKLNFLREARVMIVID